MSASTFDTLSAAREFESTGLDRRQAEAIAKTVRDGQGDLATKADMAALKSDVSALKWIAGIQGAIGLATFAAFLFLAARLLP